MLLNERNLAILLSITLAIFTVSNAITEDENVVGLRDANQKRDRPRIEGYDMDENVQ